MSKPIRIELEFSGWQPAHVNADGDVMRPCTAREMADIIAADIKLRWVKKFKGRELPLPACGAFALERGFE